ncbi:chlorophyll synthase ChlG [Sphingomonas glaciei]|uniref:Chlorophyll synthase ChlG n=1 Tax=Sphingomonas glaciei TaxID=2938948 RepID=A0ABY5MVF4_9SPHN|nr:chlorophyll synthase ChlG [Sphingomonas glaciei]UUR07956.1 chlorophyll synthase ChlG [Sphingomonas glaciei]
MNRLARPSSLPALPLASDVLELSKPITWFPPMWAFGCGVIASGQPIAGKSALLLAGVVLTGPLVCGTSQMVNDWFDRHVDAINEPARPIPSGRIAGNWGLWLAVAGTLLSMLLAAAMGSVVAVATVAALLLAWAYSAPPVRLKTSGWWGPLAVGLSYESLTWFTGSAIMLGAVPPAEVCAVLLLYGAGAWGIMTLNDFKAIEGDRLTGVRSLPAMLGVRPAVRLACLAMAAAQVGVIAVLLASGLPLTAGLVGVSLVLQLLCMVRLAGNPRRFAPWYNAIGVSLYVTGMAIAAIGLGSLR